MCFLSQIALFLHLIHIYTSRVGFSLPDGNYELVPQLRVKEEVPPEEVPAADQKSSADLYLAQVEGKPRCITLTLKSTRTMFMYLCIRY
jgi:hypothetical protein